MSGEICGLPAIEVSGPYTKAYTCFTFHKNMTQFMCTINKTRNIFVAFFSLISGRRTRNNQTSANQDTLGNTVSQERHFWCKVFLAANGIRKFISDKTKFYIIDLKIPADQSVHKVQSVLNC